LTAAVLSALKLGRIAQSEGRQKRLFEAPRWVEFHRIGHKVRAFSPCGAKIASDFIDNPAQSPDTSCADRAAPIRFLPK